MRPRFDSLLKGIFYDASNPAAYGSPQALFKAARVKRKNITLGDVKRWLEGQDAYTLHRRIVRRFPRRKFVSKGLNHIWQSDLVDLQAIKKENRGMRYLLTAIDIFSRKAFAVPIKTKKPADVIKAFEQILKQAGTKPIKLHTDMGGEYRSRAFQKWLRAKKIQWYTTHNQEIKASLVERFHRTLRQRMFRYFTAKNTLHYMSILPLLIHAYNHRTHGAIGMAPADVNRKNEKKIWDRQYAAYFKRQKKRFRYKLNDVVRIVKFKSTFQTGYKQGWQREKFKVVDRYPTIPVTYKLADLNNEVLEGTFYQQELGKVSS